MTEAMKKLKEAAKREAEFHKVRMQAMEKWNHKEPWEE